MSVFLLALSCITCGGAESAQPAVQQQMRSSQVVEFFVAFLERQLVQAAEAMPANKYSFAPTVGEFKGVRTFGEQVKHLAATNYILAAGALGERPPDDAGDETGPQDLRMKADVLEYLRGSFRALHRAAAAIDDANSVVGDVPISPLTGKATRLGYLLEGLLHAYDHYGQMVIYLRMNGVVPPASRNR
jgi:DinB superfamily